MIELRRGSMSISALSRHFAISRQTISRVLDGVEGSALATTPEKAAKGTRKGVKASADDETDMERRAALEQLHGQLRLHP